MADALVEHIPLASIGISISAAGNSDVIQEKDDTKKTDTVEEEEEDDDPVRDRFLEAAERAKTRLQGKRLRDLSVDQQRSIIAEEEIEVVVDDDSGDKDNGVEMAERNLT